MFKILEDVKPLWIDIFFIAILVLIIVFGVLRGTKKTFIAGLVFAISFFLGFCDWTDDLKTKYITKNIDITEWLPAGANPVQKLYLSYLQNFFASLVVFLIFYVVITTIIMLLRIIIRRKSGGEIIKPSAVSRVFGGILSLLYQGSIMVLLLVCFNNNYIGLNKSMDKTTVTKSVVNFYSDTLNKIDDKFVTTMTLKLYKGDVIYKADSEQIKSFKYVEENTSEIFSDSNYISSLESATTDSEKLIKERINDLYQLGIYAEYTGSEKYFVKTAEEWLVIIQKNYNNNSLEKIEYSTENFILIKNTFEELGLEKKFVDIFTNIAKGV